MESLVLSAPISKPRLNTNIWLFQPLTFSFFLGQVIKGWDIGVATMKKGEVCHLLCKPEYAYGSAGSVPRIPSNATLFFEASMCVMLHYQHLSYCSAGSGARGSGAGAKLAIEKEIQCIYFGAWLLELFPTIARRLPVLSYKRVCGTKRSYQRNKQRSRLRSKVRVSGVSVAY